MKNRHDIKRIMPKPKVKKVSVFQQAINSLNLDMRQAHLINITNKYE